MKRIAPPGTQRSSGEVPNPKHAGATFSAVSISSANYPSGRYSTHYLGGGERRGGNDGV